MAAKWREIPSGRVWGGSASLCRRIEKQSIWSNYYYNNKL